MINIGQYNELEVIKQLDFGIYLGKDNIEILMPTKWVPANTKIGDTLNVFVFRDSDDRLIATTVKPYATAETFAFLEVKQVNEIGAFLDWGMDKDLLVPFREQQNKMEAGKSYVVFVYADEETDRLVASAKLSRFIEREQIELKDGDIVDLLIYSESNLGYNAIINNLYSGLIYKNEVYEAIRVGDQIKGFVKHIREDNKIDLSLQPLGYGHILDSKDAILEELKYAGGTIALGDKSSPEDIYSRFKISKNAFKKVIGGLYKDRIITIADHEIKILVDEEAE